MKKKATPRFVAVSLLLLLLLLLLTVTVVIRHVLFFSLPLHTGVPDQKPR
jgi:hypothetical protein